MSIMHTTRCDAKETSHRFRASPGSYQGATERKAKGAQGLGDQGRKEGGEGILLFHFYPSGPVAQNIHESVHECGLEAD